MESTYAVPTRLIDEVEKVEDSLMLSEERAKTYTYSQTAPLETQVQ